MTAAKSTRCISIDAHSPSEDALHEAAEILRRGGLVAFPTETVYGLGANALDPSAVQKIFRAKNRPASDPLIVHVLSLEDAGRVAGEPTPVVRSLAEAFWPGPLTLLLPRQPDLPPAVTSGRNSVAVRVPAHPVARALLRAAAIPIAAPSANTFGHTSPTRASHVLRDLDGRIDLLLDAGPTDVGLESTILDPNSTPPVILRPGGVSREALALVLGPVRLAGEAESPDSSPGRLPQHYAPNAIMLLCDSNDPAVIGPWMRNVISQRISTQGPIGILATDEVITLVDMRNRTIQFESLGSKYDLQEIARRLFYALHALEEAGCEVILAHQVESKGLGEAINDRLVRASKKSAR